VIVQPRLAQIQIVFDADQHLVIDLALAQQVLQLFPFRFDFQAPQPQRQRGHLAEAEIGMAAQMGRDVRRMRLPLAHLVGDDRRRGAPFALQRIQARDAGFSGLDARAQFHQPVRALFARAGNRSVSGLSSSLRLFRHYPKRFSTDRKPHDL